jgi:hypothetical protein
MKGCIRCGTPDSNWGLVMFDLGETQLKKCFAKFREHCVERHELRETDVNAHMFFNLEEWTLTLFKDE